ncbi:MAG: hypothetical protein WBV39_02300 [Rudaea sp.]
MFQKLLLLPTETFMTSSSPLAAAIANASSSFPLVETQKMAAGALVATTNAHSEAKIGLMQRTNREVRMAHFPSREYSIQTDPSRKTERDRGSGASNAMQTTIRVKPMHDETPRSSF